MEYQVRHLGPCELGHINTDVLATAKQYRNMLKIVESNESPLCTQIHLHRWRLLRKMFLLTADSKGQQSLTWFQACIKYILYAWTWSNMRQSRTSNSKVHTGSLLARFWTCSDCPDYLQVSIRVPSNKPSMTYNSLSLISILDEGL